MPNAPDPGARWSRRIVLYLLLAGLLARVVYLNQVAALPFFHDPVGDSARYLDRAREILAGDWIGDRPFFYGGVFYPYLLAAAFLVFGANLYPICLAQAMAGCALGWVIYRLVKEGASDSETLRSRRRSGATACLLAIFYGPFAFLEADILMISWTLLLEMAAALALVMAQRSAGPGAPTGRSLALMAAAGIGLGLAASERPNLVALVPCVALWIVAALPGPLRWRGAASLLAGAGAVVGLVVALNHAASGRWVLLTTSSGLNFYIGNHEGARGTYEEPWVAGDAEFTAEHTDPEEASLTLARRLAGRDLDPVDASRYWFEQGRRHISAHPAETARLALRKAMLFWNAAEIPNHLNFSFLRGQAPALWLMPLGFGIVAPLGLYGLAAPSARRILSAPSLALILILLLVPMLTVLPFFVADRYRITAVPPLISLAACGLTDLARRLASPLTRRSATLRIVCVLLLGLAMSRPMAQFDESRDHWLLAQAYKKQGDLPAAVRAYRGALATSPAPEQEALLRNNLGVALTQLGDRSGAEAEYRRALAAGPDLAYPHKNLGLLLLATERAEEAFEQLTIAEKARPEDIEVARALAALHMARGEAAEAVVRARKVLAAEPGDRTALEVIRAAGEKAVPGRP